MVRELAGSLLDLLVVGGSVSVTRSPLGETPWLRRRSRWCSTRVGKELCSAEWHEAQTSRYTWNTSTEAA